MEKILAVIGAWFVISVPIGMAVGRIIAGRSDCEVDLKSPSHLETDNM